MFKKWYRLLRSRSLSLTLKILVLLLGVVTLSLSLTGFLIYGGLRDRTYENAAEGLAREAAAASASLDPAGLEQIKHPADAKKLPFVKAQRELGRLYLLNHYGDEGRWTQASLVQSSS